MGREHFARKTADLGDQQSLEKAWNFGEGLCYYKGGVGEISTQDDATQQQHKKHSQQQQCHPDGPTWTAREEGMWVSTEPLSSSKRLLSKPPPCWSQAPLSPSHQGNQLSKARRRESLGGGGVRTGPGSYPDLSFSPPPSPPVGSSTLGKATTWGSLGLLRPRSLLAS